MGQTIKGGLPLLAIAALLSACNGQPGDSSNDAGSASTDTATSQTNQEVLADTVTEAIYAGSVARVTANLEPFVAITVKASDVSKLSQRMHAMGNYKGLALLASDEPKHESTYRANFDRGAMTVTVRDGGDGRLSAYHIESK